MASKWIMKLVDPPTPAFTTMAFSKAFRDKILESFKSISTNTSLFDDLSRDLIKYCTDKDKESTPHSPESMKYKAILNSRLIDIEKFKAKLENVHKNKFINKKTEILKLYEPFVDLIEKIKLQPEIQDYPYIKEIYKVFIKPDDKIPNYSLMMTDRISFKNEYSSRVIWDLWRPALDKILEDLNQSQSNLYTLLFQKCSMGFSMKTRNSFVRPITKRNDNYGYNNGIWLNQFLTNN